MQMNEVGYILKKAKNFMKMIFSLCIYIHFLILRNQKTFFLAFLLQSTHIHTTLWFITIIIIIIIIIMTLEKTGSDEKDTLGMSFAVNVGIQDPAPNGSYC